MLIKLIYFLSVFAYSFGAKYNCDIYFTLPDFSPKCILNGLQVTETDNKIEPVARNLAAITELKFTGSVPVLAGGFCKVLPNLRKIDAHGVSMEIIKDHAFEGCENLKEIYLWNNELKEIEKNSFKGLKKLELLRLSRTNMPVFDVDLTDSKNLRVLELTELNISVFPANNLRDNKNLEELWLYSNNLFDLDIENILKYTPNLKEIYLADNNFKCSRLRDIIKLLEDKKVEVSSYIYKRKERDYTPEKIDEIHCLSDNKWNELNSRHLLNIDNNDDFIPQFKSRTIVTYEHHDYDEADSKMYDLNNDGQFPRKGRTTITEYEEDDSKMYENADDDLNNDVQFPSMEIFTFDEDEDDSKMYKKMEEVIKKFNANMEKLGNSFNAKFKNFMKKQNFEQNKIMQTIETHSKKHDQYQLAINEIKVDETINK